MSVIYQREGEDFHRDNDEYDAPLLTEAGHGVKCGAHGRGGPQNRSRCGRWFPCIFTGRWRTWIR